MKKIIFYSLKIALVSAILMLFISVNALAQIENFSYQPEKVKIGHAFIYKKSNQDGSNLHWVATYISNDSYIESLKWSVGSSGATLVTAEMDWSIFSVRKFIGGNISPEGDRIIGAQLDQLDKEGNYRVQIGSEIDTMLITSLPWHSYDFDFASLNLIWPHLKEQKSSFTINIADVVFGNPQPEFKNKGLVEIKYLKTEMRQGQECHKYHIDGPGLENRGGIIWLSKSEKYFVEYLIDLPDENSYENMKFQFDRVQEMNIEEWEKFKLNIASGNR